MEDPAATLAELLPDGWTVGRVQTRLDHTPELFTLRVQAQVQPFVPGQFLRLGLPEEDRFVSRAYSVASPHGLVLDFYVALVPEGELTPALHALRPGDPLAVSTEAAGHFTLEHVPSAPALWLISTGTGLAPYLAMLREGSLWERFARVVLVHGVRLHQDLGYREEIARLGAGRELVYVPVVSREPARDGSLEGRIPANLEALEARAGVTLSPESSQVLLCGNPGMVEEVEALLAARGMARNRRTRPGNVTTERYW